MLRTNFESLAENDNLRKRRKEIEDNSKYAIKNLSYHF